MRYLILLLCLACASGCNESGMFKFFKQRVKPQEGKVTQQQKIDQTSTVRADLTVDIDPYTEPKQASKPPIDILVMGQTITVPGNAKLTLKVRTEAEEKESDYYSMIGSFKMSKKMGSLIAIGGFLMAAAAILCVFGMWKLGVAAACAGITLIACGVAIDKYPWVFFIVMVAIIGGCCYMLYTTIIAKRKELAFTKVCDQIDVMKHVVPDVVKEHLTDPLAKDPLAKLINNHTTAARSRG
jgi:hypothetical protein